METIHWATVNFLFFFFFFFAIFNFYLRPLNTQGSNNMRKCKAGRKNGKPTCLRDFHIYFKFFMKLLQIWLGQLSMIHWWSEIFMSFRIFRHRTAPTARTQTVPKPNLFFLTFLLVTVTPGLKLFQAFGSKVKISFMIGKNSLILTLYISVNKYCKFLYWNFNWYFQF